MYTTQSLSEECVLKNIEQCENNAICILIG